MWPTPLHPGVGHPCPGAANKSLEPEIETQNKTTAEPFHC